MCVPAGSLDLITLYHVIEHLRDPSEALRICADWLREGGLCIAEVPSFECTSQGPGHQYQKGHLHYFNLPTLQALASQSGFRMEEGGTHYGGENLRCYFRRESSQEPMSRAIPGNVDRLIKILQSYTWRKHYTSSIPHLRAWNRLRRNVGEILHSCFRRESDILSTQAAGLRRQ